MRWTRFRLVLAAILLVALGLTTAALLARHEPDFYRRAAIPPGPKRSEVSNEFFVRDFVQFIASFDGGRGPWNFTFTQNQINSFLEEDFVRFGDAEYFRKQGIVDPRIEFSNDQVRLAFRYGTGWWSTILSYDLRIWLAKSEVNVLAVEILRRRAGALPIPMQQTFEEIKDIARKRNIDVEWYRHEGNPVAIVKFQTDRPRPSAQLRHIEIADGTLSLHGLSFDPVQNPLDEPIRKTPESPMP